MADRERILFVATVDSHLFYFHLPFMRLLSEMGYEVEAAAAPSGFAQRIESAGFRVFPFGFTKNPLDPRLLGVTLRLIRLMRERRYALVHVHTPVAGFLGRYAARRADVPRIMYTAHGFHFHSHGRWWSNCLYHALERAAACWTDTLITINREDFAVASRDFARGRTKVVYVPGVGTDCSRFTPATESRRTRERSSLHLGEGSFVVAWVAEFSRRKRPDDAIAAVHELSHETSVRLVMLGSGPLFAGIESAVLQGSRQDAVVLRGCVPNVADYLAASDALLSTSGQEGLPRNVMEAMAAGLPVVAYDIRGCRDLVVDGETGFLVPFGDVNGLACKLAWLVQHPDERYRMGEAGRKRIEETFSLDAVLPQMKTVYQDELGRGGTQS